MRRWVRWVVGATALAALVAWLPAPAAFAQVSARNAAATASYLREYYAVTRAEVEHFPAAIGAIEALATRLDAECPGVLANMPKPATGAKPTASEVEISEEESGAALLAGEHTEYRRYRAFAAAVSRLRWSDRVLTRLVHSDAAGEVEKAELPAPDLCADARAWVGSDYQTVSAATTAFLHRYATVSQATEGAGEKILHGLARYESRSDRRVVRKIVTLEKAALSGDLARLFAALGKIGEALEGGSTAPAS